MTLNEFIALSHRTQWITDSGLHYYVRKSLWFPGLIELANCSAMNNSGLNYWRFNKRYARSIPFIAEQTINVGLAHFYVLQGWIARDGGGGIPSFASPLAVERFGDTDHFKRLDWSYADPVDGLKRAISPCPRAIT